MQRAVGTCPRPLAPDRTKRAVALTAVRRTLIISAAVLILVGASPAIAGLTVNANGTVTTSGTSGGTVVVTLDGITDGPTLVQGLTAELTLTFTGVSNGGTTYNFFYSLFDSSSAPITGSRISSFGFDTDPNVTGGSVTGAFDVLQLDKNYPIIPDPSFCVFDPNGTGGVCTGSGGGILQGQTGTGMLSLNFGTAPGTITLSNFVDRYQSITGAGNVTSAVGQQTSVRALPEPATWAMMLLGFAGMAAVGRRRKLVLNGGA